MVNYASENVLYRNNGDGTFTDVSVQAGVNDRSENIGGTFVDYDNDGDLDLYVTKYSQPNLLYRNNGDGTFTNVAKEAGVADPGMSFYHQFADYDNDGDMDLYVASGMVTPAPDALYRNNGDGTFTEVTKQAGILHHLPWSGLMFFDYNNDGWLDLYVVINQDDSNLLYRNNKDGTFTDVSKQAGVYGGIANPGAHAGNVTVGDYDNDGWLDIFVANNGPNSLYHNNGDGRFTEGKLLNEANTFTDIAAQVGITEVLNTQVASSGDYNGDGFLDLFMTNGYMVDEPDALYRNNGNDNHWLYIDLVGVRSNRNGIGARIHVIAGDLSMIREVNGGTFGMDSLTAEFGLGKHNMVDLVEIRWPSGLVELFKNVPVNRVIQVNEGSGQYQVVAVQPHGKLLTTFGQVKRTALLQNYPNPFNPETWIPFVLDEAAFIDIRIYDVSGKRVRTLLLGQKALGEYRSKAQSAYWDGKNDAGEVLGSGIYFYEMRTGDYTSVRKAMLRK